MRSAARILMLLGLWAGPAGAEGQGRQGSVRAAELGSKVRVIGQLGLPLGTVVQIDATIVDGESLRMKRYQGTYLLRVEAVAGKRLGKPEIMEFESRTVLPANVFDLYESRHGKRAGPLADTDIRELNKGYVGQRFVLLAYETGAFGGIPENLPVELTWQDTSFHFFTRLVLLKRIK